MNYMFGSLTPIPVVMLTNMFLFVFGSTLLVCRLSQTLLHPKGDGHSLQRKGHSSEYAVPLSVPVTVETSHVRVPAYDCDGLIWNVFIALQL